MGLVGWLPAALGFAAGGVFLYGLDHLLPHLHLEEKQPEGLSTNWKKDDTVGFRGDAAQYS